MINEKVKNVPISYSKNKVVDNPESGIQKPFFNWEDYKIMRQKYRDGYSTGKEGLVENKYWIPEDFQSTV